MIFIDTTDDSLQHYNMHLTFIEISKFVYTRLFYAAPCTVLS